MDSTSWVSLTEKLRLADLFHQVLTEAQTLRPQKQRWINDELQWVIDERQTMLNAVNTKRSIRGLAPVPNIDRAEQSAMGHSDYTRKFALYCAEMVMQT